MKIGVISDTHVSRIDQLSPQLIDTLQHVDLIVHLGDYTGIELLEGLKGLGNFQGVFGNMDPLAIRAELPEKDLMDVDGKRLGLIHGWGAPTGIHEKIKDSFKNVNAIIYGHTHIATNEVIDGVLFFNPGSATGKLPALHKTCGILVIEDSIRGEIITID
ncbi:MAG: metallophosphoesterase family protein [Chloroflexota bacterium]|nr:metallophosphoesterase family protein [Chloroflexota bacterium]